MRRSAALMDLGADLANIYREELVLNFISLLLAIGAPASAVWSVKTVWFGPA